MISLITTFCNVKKFWLLKCFFFAVTEVNICTYVRMYIYIRTPTRLHLLARAGN